MTNTSDQTGQEGLAGQASAAMQDAATVVQDKASELRGQGSTELRGQFDKRSIEAAAEVRALAKALRRSGNDLNNEGNSKAAQLTGKVADRIERIGNYLEQKRGDELMSDVETFARRRPWMLAGIGMLVGLAGARFMKASSEQRYDTHRQTKGQLPRGAGAPYSSGSDYEQGEGSVGDAFIDPPGSVGSNPAAPGAQPPARDAYAGRR